MERLIVDCTDTPESIRNLLPRSMIYLRKTPYILSIELDILSRAPNGGVHMHGESVDFSRRSPSGV